MGAGFKDFASGAILTAGDVDNYLMRQTVMTFADASARDTALSAVLDEGMVAYLEDTDTVTVYDGSAWNAIGGGGSRYVPVTAYSPTYSNFTLGNGTDSFFYAVSGDMMMIEGKIIFGSTTVFGTSCSLYIPPAYKITTYDTASQIVTNLCQITYRESGVQDIIAHGKTANADRILFLNDLANLTYLKEAIANGATPFTFASGDEIRIRAQFLIKDAP